MKESTKNITNELTERYPALAPVKEDVFAAFDSIQIGGEQE